MKKQTNPAAKLFQILKTAKIPDLRNKIGLESWPILLKVPSSNKALLLKRLGGAMELPLLIKDRIENIEGVNLDLHLRWVPTVENAFNSNNLPGPFTTFVDKYSNEDIYGVELCADTIAKYYPEPEIETDKLEALRQEVESLIEELKNAEIDKDVKQFSLYHLFNIRNAIEEYQIFGMRPLVSAYGLTVGTAMTQPQDFVKTANASSGKRFMKCIKDLGAIITVGIGAEKLIEGGEKILELLQ